jgi:hypothetical protein
VSAVETLTKARAILAKPKAWTKGHMAKAADRRVVQPESEDAVCFCAVGAYFAAVACRETSPGEEQKGFDILGESIPKSAKTQLVARYNDAKTTRKKDILALFDRAIRRAKKAEKAVPK